jgi:hypothetical protein
MLTPLKNQSFNCITEYALENLNLKQLNRIEEFFNNLPIDPYLEGNYRFRRLSNFVVSSKELIKLPHSVFFQSKNYNPLLGDVAREYQELDDAMIQLEAFQKIVFEFFKYCQLCSQHNQIAVHQIRTIASQNKLGNPAPEGIHKDGVDLVGIFCVNREKISGGETSLYKDKNGSPIFQEILNPGEILIFNDKQFLHYTSPIKPTSDRLGIRDVFVLTCPGLFAKNYEKN